jgi:uncharacterized BrkB/YihY/UPF0761 family membrane protein
MAAPAADGPTPGPTTTNPVERVLRGVDGLQQRHRAPAFVVAVVKKFGDDRGTMLAVLVAYYAFMALFPLLLLMTTVLGFIGQDRLEGTLLATTLEQFPVLGQQIGSSAPHPLTGSALGIAVGALGLLYGSLGISQAAQHAMAEVWNVRGAVRPGYLQRLGRSFLFLGLLAVAVALTAGVGAVATMSGRQTDTRVLTLTLLGALNVGLYLAAFRVLTPKWVKLRLLVPGAIGGGLVYTALGAVGTALVQHQLRHAQAVYGQFAFVLGLIFWLLLIAQVTIYAAEVNVVLARRLWPRSILQPPLTRADRRVLAALAHAQQRRPEEVVGVGFDPDAVGGATRDAAAAAAVNGASEPPPPVGPPPPPS